MGAWGEENFGNDDAGDWIYELEKSKGVNILLKPIKAINANQDYLESSDCSEALAASEVIAASITGDLSRIPDEAKEWLNKKSWVLGSKPKIEKEHAALAKQCIERILTESELKDLWQETEHYPKWQHVQSTLLSMISNT